MALLSLVEAAQRTGWSIELLEYLTKRAPKHGEKDRTLPCKHVEGEKMVDDKALQAYVDYLGEPWPKSPRAKRPRIPKAILDDVRAESHHECAICGRQDNGEVAHLVPVADSRNNSPDNLLLLCPNHHAKFDDAYCLNNNVSLPVAREAKSYKRAARRRMLRHEDNSRRAMSEVMKRDATLQAKIDAATDSSEALALNTEIRLTLQSVPKVFTAAKQAAEAHQTYSPNANPFDALAVTRAVQGVDSAPVNDAQLREVVEEFVAASSQYRMPDEVDCPHCDGRGQTGLVGDLCSFCQGSCVVSQDKAAEYDPQALDEVDCPHCDGRGQTGLVGDLCSFCQGSCLVSQDKAAEYDPQALDEVDCPHCDGKGQTGLVGDLCSFCQGSCLVAGEKAAWYVSNSRDPA